MIRIAIVGDIGSGKSHIAKLFGYPVFNADYEVSRLYKKSRKSYNKLKKSLPKYITSFPVKKKEILKAVIQNRKNLKKITKIIHPQVKHKLKNFVKKHNKKKFVILDIPLLIENKINTKKDILVFLDSKQKDINKRLRNRPSVNLKIIKKLKKFQLPIEFKKKKSNFVIKNNFNDNFVKKNVKKILEEILLNVRSYT